MFIICLLLIIGIGYRVHGAAESPGACEAHTVSSISAGYGSDNGTSIVRKEVDLGPLFFNQCWFFSAGDLTRPRPTVVFLPGFGHNNPHAYDHLLTHIARKGYHVLFVHCALNSFPRQRGSYRRIFRTVRHGVRKFSSFIDTTRIGFVGHSYGAGATPYVVNRCIKEKNWCGNGSFQFLMAPFFTFAMKDAELRMFPSDVPTVVQVYENDDVTDHRIARDLFLAIGVEDSLKSYMLVRSDTLASTGCILQADHALPCNEVHEDGEVNSMDVYAVFRVFDALAEFGFTQNPAAYEIAPGNGSSDQTRMGIWVNGTPVKPMIVTHNPPLPKPSAFTVFGWCHPWNPRRKVSTVSVPCPEN